MIAARTRSFDDRRGDFADSDEPECSAHELPPGYVIVKVGAGEPHCLHCVIDLLDQRALSVLFRRVCSVQCREFGADSAQLMAQLWWIENFDLAAPPGQLLGQGDDEVGPHLGDEMSVRRR